jgi:hypothetical protein
VWGVVEGRGDRTKAFDAAALRAAAGEREEGEDSWVFTGEGDIGEALEAVTRALLQSAGAGPQGRESGRGYEYDSGGRSDAGR